MDVLDQFVDADLRLELILVAALHEEAERLIGPATGEISANS
ncbi:hypothetical protein [Microbispora sp. KK1-11]|nr:hypothetical protein [Microbispora sp. KK1-11]